MASSSLQPSSMSPDDLHTDRLEHLWDRDRDGNSLIQTIDLELEDLDEWNEIDDRDGRDDDDGYENWID